MDRIVETPVVKPQVQSAPQTVPQSTPQPESIGVKFKPILRFLRKGKILSMSLTDAGNVVLSTWDSIQRKSISFNLSPGEMLELSTKLRLLAEGRAEKEFSEGIKETPYPQRQD
jgi:hypothetical protein